MFTYSWCTLWVLAILGALCLMLVILSLDFFFLWKGYIYLNSLINYTSHASFKVSQSAYRHHKTFLIDPIWWSCLKTPPHFLANCTVFVVTTHQIFFFLTFKITSNGLVIPYDLFYHLPWCFLGHTCKLASIHLQLKKQSQKQLTLKSHCVPGDLCAQVSKGIALRSHQKTESGFPNRW